MLKSVVTTAFAGTLALAGLAQGATITYDFSGDAGTVPTDWVKGSGDSFALDGSGHYVETASAGNNGETLDVSIFHLSDRQAGTDFSISTTFTSTALTLSGGANSWSVAPAIRFLASSETDDTSPTRSYYVLSVTRTNETSTVSIGKASGSALPSNSASATFGVPVTNTPYTLSVTGTYLTGVDAGKLKLTYSLTDGTDTWGSSVTDASPLTGDYFGLRQRARNFSGGTATQTVSYDEYSLTYEQVPEPGTLSLVGIAGLALLRRRRR